MKPFELNFFLSRFEILNNFLFYQNWYKMANLCGDLKIKPSLNVVNKLLPEHYNCCNMCFIVCIQIYDAIGVDGVRRQKKW